MRVDLSQENEIKCSSGHLTHDNRCPDCQHAVTLFNGFLGNGYVATAPRLPDARGMQAPPESANVGQSKVSGDAE
jgi:hypothetical protein